VLLQPCCIPVAVAEDVGAREDVDPHGRDSEEFQGEAGGLTLYSVEAPVLPPRRDHRVGVDGRDGEGHEGVAAEGQLAGEGCPGPPPRLEPDSDHRVVEGAVVRDPFCLLRRGSPPRLCVRMGPAGRHAHARRRSPRDMRTPGCARCASRETTRGG